MTATNMAQTNSKRLQLAAPLLLLAAATLTPACESTPKQGAAASTTPEAAKTPGAATSPATSTSPTASTTPTASKAPTASSAPSAQATTAQPARPVPADPRTTSRPTARPAAPSPAPSPDPTAPVAPKLTEIPTGQSTPEGAACDAVASWIRCDSKAWLATLVRPIYGPEGDLEYAQFKTTMTAKAEAAKNDPNYVLPRFVRICKARPFSATGPSSAGYAVANFRGNMFVDIYVEIPDKGFQRLRYHVMQDQDRKWYFEPRPDLAPLFSMGLNDETSSTEVIWEAE